MYKSANLFTLSICGLLSFSALISAEVYKWVDEQGKVHYSDKPINESAKKITVNKPPSDKQLQAAQLNAKRLIEREKRIQENQSEDRQDLNRKNAEKSKLDAICLDAKKELEILMTPVRVVQTDENGKEVFLSDDERTKEIKLYREAISNHCSE